MSELSADAHRSKYRKYFAYGINLNHSSMHSLCPFAVPIGKYELPDHRLVFRGVADVEYCEGHSVLVGS